MTETSSINNVKNDINVKSQNIETVESVDYFSKVQEYFFSKKMIYLVIAIGLCVAVYWYMNKNKKEELQNQTNDKENNQQNQEPEKEPEIIFSQELMNNLYKNNTTPYQYLMMLRQQGQIPQGPLPKIVLDYEINEEQNNNNINNNNNHNMQQNKPLETINEEQYEKIEDSEDLVDQKLTKEEIEKINQKVMTLNK